MNREEVDEFVVKMCEEFYGDLDVAVRGICMDMSNKIVKMEWDKEDVNVIIYLIMIQLLANKIGSVLIDVPEWLHASVKLTICHIIDLKSSLSTEETQIIDTD